MRLFSKILILCIAVTVTSCHSLPTYFAGDNAVAKVGNRVLERSEVEQIMPHNLSQEDSLAFVDMYVDKWVKKQLKLREAELMFSSSAEDIESMVEDYRQSLLIRKLDQQLVDHTIDTMFTEATLYEYYKTHQDEFRIDRTIVKGRVVKFSDAYRRSAQLKILMGSRDVAAQKDFADICSKNNFVVTDHTSTWVDFAEFLSALPTVRDESYDFLLKEQGVQQMSFDDDRYYFQITSVRYEGEVAPLEQVKETIRRILFNRRQSEIIKAHEDEAYQRAVEEGEVKIYDKKTNKIKE